MGAQHRHPHASDVELQVGGFHDLAGLGAHLTLFPIPARLVNRRVVTEEVKGVRMRHDARHHRLLVEERLGLLLQFFHSGGPGATGALVRADDHPLDGERPVDGREGHDEQDGGAIAHRVERLLAGDEVAIDLGHHQRHAGLHAEGAGAMRKALELSITTAPAAWAGPARARLGPLPALSRT